MSFIDKLEKRFGHLAVPNVMLTLIIAQLVIYVAVLIGRVDYGSLTLEPRAVLAGEWWRLVSFLIMPPNIATGALSALFLAFFWYILWMMSSALESVWGVFRFNVYLITGILFTVAGAFIGQFVSPSSAIVASPQFLYFSIFFAFATTHPNIEFLLFFVIPVKVKWLAWFGAVAFVALPLISVPSLGWRLMIIAPVINYFLFFGRDLINGVKSKQRRAKFDAERKAIAEDTRHVCSVCGATEQSHPEREFRYKMLDGEAICICNVCRDKELAENA